MYCELMWYLYLQLVVVGIVGTMDDNQLSYNKISYVKADPSSPTQTGSVARQPSNCPQRPQTFP